MEDYELTHEVDGNEHDIYAEENKNCAGCSIIRMCNLAHKINEKNSKIDMEDCIKVFKKHGIIDK